MNQRCTGGEPLMNELIMTVRNPLDKAALLPIYIESNGSEISNDWLLALRCELQKNSQLEKNYCWHGWPKSQRNLDYLCRELSKHTKTVHEFNNDGIWYRGGLEPFELNTEYTPETVMNPLSGIDEPGLRGGGPNHTVMNTVHNYFEHLQGTVEQLSPYYKLASPAVKYSIRQINNLCHEIESLCLSIKKEFYSPQWVRPSQITTFLNARRYKLNRAHREGFRINGYDRKFGHLYMHWSQIGKTLMEVYRDENAPKLDQATCDAITHLQYYSGEFDLEWGRDVCYGNHKWHTEEIDGFNQWLRREGYDPSDLNLSLGYLELGKINLQRSFGTESVDEIWKIMSSHLDIFSLQIDNDCAVYDYAWSDLDHEKKQISCLMPGYLSHV
jgi:hypothetical protein